MANKEKEKEGGKEGREEGSGLSESTDSPEESARGGGGRNGVRFSEEEGELVHLTDLASLKIKEIFKENCAPENSLLRVKVTGGGCSGFSYAMDFVLTNQVHDVFKTDQDPIGDMDRLIKTKGVSLIVDEMSLMYINGTTIDYKEQLSGGGFSFENPNVKSTCGCGSSFSV